MAGGEAVVAKLCREQIEKVAERQIAKVQGDLRALARERLARRGAQDAGQARAFAERRQRFVGAQAIPFHGEAHGPQAPRELAVGGLARVETRQDRGRGRLAPRGRRDELPHLLGVDTRRGRLGAARRSRAQQAGSGGAHGHSTRHVGSPSARPRRAAPIVRRRRRRGQSAAGAIPEASRGSTDGAPAWRPPTRPGWKRRAERRRTSRRR